MREKKDRKVPKRMKHESNRKRGKTSCPTRLNGERYNRDGVADAWCRQEANRKERRERHTRAVVLKRKSSKIRRQKTRERMPSQNER